MSDDDNNQDSNNKNPKKLKVAIIFGYVGFGFFGLQHNQDPIRPTIEAQIIDALHQVGYISDENMMGQFLKKIGWERASRTDKGVSALRNVANVKLILPLHQSEEEWIAPVNAILKPKRIEVFRIIQTMSSFDSYKSCTGRKYEYLLPTYALLPPPGAAEEGDNNNNKSAAAIREVLLASSMSSSLDDKRRRQRDDPTVEPTDLPQELFFTKMLQHRVCPSTVHKLRLFFSQMEGTNSFHNFTPNVTADQDAASRFIRSIEVSDPFTISITLPTPKNLAAAKQQSHHHSSSSGNNNNNNNDNNDDEDSDSEGMTMNLDDYDMKVYDVEWVRIRLDGQSFMLNQIRKMIGGAIEVINRGGDSNSVREAFAKTFRKIMPMAPANGLFLATLKMDAYNTKLQRAKEQGAQNSAEKQLLLIPDVAVDDEMRTLVEKCIGEHECKGQITARWVAGLIRSKPEDWMLKNES